MQLERAPGRSFGERLFPRGEKGDIAFIHEYDEKSGYISYLQEKRHVPLFASQE
jgi:hypothetical protein